MEPARGPTAPRRRGTVLGVSGLVGLTLAATFVLSFQHSPDRAEATPGSSSTASGSTGPGDHTPAGGTPDSVTGGDGRVAAWGTELAPMSDEWSPSISEDFDLPAVTGTFAQTYPGWADYDGYRDTHKTGLYDSDRVVSVTDGILTEHLHSQARQPLVVSITPVPHVQTYGRYEIRFRADIVPGYKIAWLLWPADNDQSNGEIDFPEAWLGEPGSWDGVDEIMGFSHDTSGGGGRANAFTLQTGQSPQAWHTAVIEWRPDSLTFALDGVAKTTTDPAAIPHVPMYWSMQTETDDSPSVTSAGDVQIDYVRAWTYQAPG
jgi:hypothetical protein